MKHMKNLFWVKEPKHGSIEKKNVSFAKKKLNLHVYHLEIILIQQAIIK